MNYIFLFRLASAFHIAKRIYIFVDFPSNKKKIMLVQWTPFFSHIWSFLKKLFKKTAETIAKGIIYSMKLYSNFIVENYKNVK